MKVEDEMVLGRELGQVVHHVDDSLVIGVEEVYLESLDSEFRVMGEGLRCLLLGTAGVAPEDDPDILAVSVSHDLFEVEAVAELHQRACAPAGIHKDVFEIVGCGEIDEIFVGGGVGGGSVATAVVSSVAARGAGGGSVATAVVGSIAAGGAGGGRCATVIVGSIAAGGAGGSSVATTVVGSIATGGAGGGRCATTVVGAIAT